MKKIILKALQNLGYSLVKHNADIKAQYPDIQENEFWELYDFCKPYTMTSVERIYSLYSSVSYVLARGLGGDFVECGVWRGGSSMMIAKMLENRNIRDRKIYLYDTFEGMSEPSASDVAVSGESAEKLMEDSVQEKETSVWCLADLSDVKSNLALTGYPENNLVFVKGKVEDTLPEYAPSSPIALLRLDTDWYESTIHELNTLFPMLQENGVLIIDDYGHWQGCRQAVDEYFSTLSSSMLMNRIDYTGRTMIKNFK